MSPALASRFLSLVQPGKTHSCNFYCTSLLLGLYPYSHQAKFLFLHEISYTTGLLLINYLKISYVQKEKKFFFLTFWKQEVFFTWYQFLGWPFFVCFSYKIFCEYSWSLFSDTVENSLIFLDFAFRISFFFFFLEGSELYSVFLLSLSQGLLMGWSVEYT